MLLYIQKATCNFQKIYADYRMLHKIPKTLRWREKAYYKFSAIMSCMRIFYRYNSISGGLDIICISNEEAFQHQEIIFEYLLHSG